MKQTNTLFALSICALLGATSCNNAGNKTTGSSDTVSTTTTMDSSANAAPPAQSIASEARDAMVHNPDSNFVVKATMANLEEMALIQAGMEKSASSELKAHAKMMMADHKKLGEKVKAYSAKMNYVLPDNDGGKSADDMSKLGSNKGADWDKAWTDMMVDKHIDAISMFEKGQMDVKDGMLKSMIGDALPTLHKHLDMMKMMQDKMKK
jgi:putative membrane protein